jgi:hypothetical protein
LLCIYSLVNNHLLISGVTVGASTVPIKQYLNFDKGAAGLLLLIYCTRCRTGTDFLRMLKPTALVVAIGCVVVFAIALLSGAIGPDLKWPTFAIQFLATNFFFTCIAEEAFFRGLLQARLRKLFAITIYRVTQEAVSNAIKHANATYVKIHIQYETEKHFIQVTISDDGCGFNIDRVTPGRLGLIGMRERVHAVGGTMQLESQPSHGTTIRFVVSA